MPELAAIGMATTRWLATAKVARPMHAPMIPPPVSSVTSTPGDTHSSCVAMLNESLTQGSRPILGNAYASTAAAAIQAPGASTKTTAATASYKPNEKDCRPSTTRTDAASDTAIASTSAGI